MTPRDAAGVVVLDLSGRVVLGEEAEAFRKEIKDLLAIRRTKILLDLEDVTRIDSTGIGALVEAVILTAQEGGRLKLLRVPRLIHNVLSTHHLLSAFEIFDNEEAALASFE
jgi:anti-sigma B factor antagonist